MGLRVICFIYIVAIVNEIKPDKQQQSLNQCYFFISFNYNCFNKFVISTFFTTSNKHSFQFILFFAWSYVIFSAISETMVDTVFSSFLNFNFLFIFLPHLKEFLVSAIWYGDRSYNEYQNGPKADM